MFPMQFDYRLLESLPLPDDESIKRVLQILKTMSLRRIMPYFKNKRGTDATILSRIGDRLSIQRLEDEDNEIHMVSFVTHKEKKWTIHIHERVFDYLAFVIPSDPESRLGGSTSEERKMLAFSEFMLRHEIEHMLYPEESERQVIRADVVFAMDRRTNDPTYYGMLRNALGDEMTGLQGKPFLEVLDAAEQDRAFEYLITRLLSDLVENLSDIPQVVFQDLFPVLDADLKTKLLGEFYRKSRDTSYSLLRRAHCLQKVMRLFSLVLEQDEKEAEVVFDAFKDRWGVFYLFHELDLPESSLEGKDTVEIFSFFKTNLTKFLEETERSPSSPPDAPKTGAPKPKPPSAAVKTLKDRIEEVRNDPAFPRQAIDTIEKNKTSAVGHSGPKYTELIETLLAIPWGKIQKIIVDPTVFEEGLDRTHYGLKKPKEIICDFFTNLIWRFQQEPKSEDPIPHKTGSAFLFVGPPGVGKTSLAISIARNLGIPYHKVSLGGMRDEADLKGHGFTYEGSKPGAIVQGLIKMGVMNGMYIMDEADKTEKFAIATLLEILDPEQNHLYHDKYTQTTVDIDLSNCHFILTANTLETVPPPVVNRCEVVFLDRYGVEEKIAIAQQYLIQRIRQSYQISEEDIFFDPDLERPLLKHLVKTYTYEPGVRELERIIRRLFLRLFRKEILVNKGHAVKITRLKIKQYLEEPIRPWQINEENRIGEMLALGVNVERGLGSIIPIQATRIMLGEERGDHGQGFLSMVHATGNIQKIMDESRKVATTGILHCAKDLSIDTRQIESPIHLHFMGSSTPKDGPSAGGAIALALASALSEHAIRRDVAMTGEIDTHGRIKAVGGLDIKLETAVDAGCKTLIIPMENLRGEGGIERLPDALKNELQILSYPEWKGEHDPFDYERHVLQIVSVDHIAQAADIAFIDEAELKTLEETFAQNALSFAKSLKDFPKDLTSCFSLLYAKSMGELNLEGSEDIFWEGCSCIFLSRSDVKADILKKFPALETRSPIKNSIPTQEDIRAIIEEIKASISKDHKKPLKISLVAPFYFLARSGIHTEDYPPTSSFEGLKLFANNYTAQGIKIKACKPALNRLYCLFSRLNVKQIDDCPFLKRRDGIYTVDLSFIPEKYSLDVKHAEKILNRCLKRWLTAVSEV